MIPGVVGSSQYVVPASSLKEVTFGNGTSVGVYQPTYNKVDYFVYDSTPSDLMDATPFPTSTFTDFDTATLNATTNNNNNAAYENGRFFYCNFGASRVYTFTTSSDSVASITVTGMRAIKWFAPMSAWVGVGTSGAVATSTDGTTWTARTAIGTANLNTLETDGTTLVAAGATGTMYSTTSTLPGSISWTSRTSSFGTSAIRTITYSPINTNSNKWVATGALGTVAYSINGTSWTQKSTGISASTDVMGAVYHMGRWVINNLVATASGSTAQVVRSNSNDPSGSWTVVSSAQPSDASRPFSDGKYIMWVTYGGKLRYAR